MVKCKAKEHCFYNGKRFKEGDAVNFQGAAKDVPEYLEPIKESKK